MVDFQFFQPQDGQGPIVWGDFIPNDRGDLQLISGPAEDMQAASCRLLTNREAGRNYRLYPQLGADLGRLTGNIMGPALLDQIERQCQMTLTYDGRFPSGTTVKAIPMGQDSIKIYILLPSPDGRPSMISPPIDFDLNRGIRPDQDREVSVDSWIWRRSPGGIQESHNLWRAWIGSQIAWRLSPERLVTRNVVHSSLEHLGYFPEPFLIYKDGFLFCAKGPSEGLYTPRAWAKADGWQVDQPIQEVLDIPDYSLPDGVWCDPRTNWNLIIIIGGVTAGRYHQEQHKWQFREVREV